MDSSFSFTEARVLIELRESGVCTANDLIERMNIDKSYMSRTLSSLEKEGLIEKSASPADLRTYRITLSEKGKVAAVDLEEKSNLLIENLLGHLSEGESAQLCAAMDRIKDHITRDNPLIMW